MAELLIPRLVERLDSARFQPVPLPPADWTGEIVRPDDLLHLVVSAYNLRPAFGPTGPRLVRIAAQRSALLAFELPPQAIAEQAFFEHSDTNQLARPGTDLAGDVGRPSEALGAADTARARVARPSRLVFRLPDTIDSLPLSVEGLLQWESLEPVLAPLATLPAEPSPDQLAEAPSITAPGPLETALELPYRLLLSPNADARWIHSRQPVTHRGRTELWHTRLGAETPAGTLEEASAARPLPLRAIWSPDHSVGVAPAKTAPDPELGTAAMNPNNRHQIVTLTSDYAAFRRVHVPPVQPSPIGAAQLMLSALGGWLRSRGHWELPEIARGNAQGPDLDITEWVHVATQGRDHYVRIVYDGCLFPLGHRASLVKITERRFEDVGGAPVALLRQFVYVVVREPVREYERGRYPHAGREMPFTRIEVKTLVTPHLVNPEDPRARLPGADGSFWMLSRGTGLDVPFELVGTDAGGRLVPFSMPLVFVRRGEAHMDVVRALWRTAPQPGGTGPRRRAVVNGTAMDFAPGGPAGDNAILTPRAFYFDVVGDGGCGEYLPTLFKADVTLPSVEQIVGRGATTTIGYFDGYLAGGFDASVGLFARIEKDAGQLRAAGALALSFSAEQAGGIATPNVQLTGLTTKVGPVAGALADAVNDRFDPKSFFGGLPGGQTALLFGSFSLTDILPKGTLTADAPAMDTRVETDPVRGRLAVTRYAWETTPQPWPDDGSIVRFVPQPSSRLAIDARVETSLEGGESRAETTGSLRDFEIQFFKAVTVRFDMFAFHSASGRKLDVNVALNAAAPLEFGGDLDFIQQLSELIPPGLFGDGPSIELLPDRIALGFDIGLPPLTIGVFALKNLGLNAGLQLPFADGRPLLDLGFARRESPFLLTVSLLGGGGFVHVQLDTSGLKVVEAALEFGASVDLDIGVASGNVHVFAGIYFKLEKRDEAGGEQKLQVVLTGYMRVGGALSVLGIITVSVELNLSFSYDSGTRKVSGRATLTVNVEIAFFSKSVELSVERSFGRDGGDPAFGELIHTPDVWAEYVGAFG